MPQALLGSPDNNQGPDSGLSHKLRPLNPKYKTPSTLNGIGLPGFLRR